MIGAVVLWAVLACSCKHDAVDTDRDDTVGAETGEGDSTPLDTAPEDTAPRDTSAGDTGRPDTGETGEPIAPDLTLYVALDGVDDGNDCADPELPCASPEHAAALLAAIDPGLSVRISMGPGRYDVVTLDVAGRSNFALVGAGVEQTRIVGPFPDDALAPVPVISVSGENITISDFAIAGIASDEANGAGVLVLGPSSGVVLSDLRIDGTGSGEDQGGAMGINLLAPGTDFGIESTIVRVQVIGFTFKAGVLLKGGFQVAAFDRCVFYGNDHAIGMTNELGETVDPQVVIENSIFVGNRVGAGVHLPLEDPTSVRIDWNLFGPTDQPVERLTLGVGNLEATDPLFRSAPGDLSLQSTAEGDPGCSPALDAGDPASPWSHEPSPNGGRVNLGHLGNTCWASRSCTARRPRQAPGP